MNLLKKLFGKKDFPKCPYCGFEFEEPPTRKRKCPECKEDIYLKKSDKDIKLITKKEKQAIDRAKEEREFIETIAREEVMSEVEYHKYRDNYYEKTGDKGYEASFRWSLYNYLLGEAVKKNKFTFMSYIYNLMAEARKSNHKDYIMWKKQAQKMQLFDMKNQYADLGIKYDLDLITLDNSCEYCKTFKKKRYTIDEAIEELPIPHENCTHKYGCRCIFLPDIKEDYIDKLLGEDS